MSTDADREQLIEALKNLVPNDTYETEYDGRMETYCHSCGHLGWSGHKDCCDYQAAHALLTRLLGAGWDSPPAQPPNPSERIPCSICSRLVARMGMNTHVRAKHSAPTPDLDRA